MKKRVRIVTILGLVVLVILTFTSRSAYNYNLPQVTAYKFESTYVPLTAKATATLYYEGEAVLKAGEDWVIASVHVKNGDFIHAGDLLLTLDRSNHDIRVMSSELEILRLQNALAAVGESMKAPDASELNAPYNGRFINLEEIATGEKVSKGDTVGRFINDDKMLITFPFAASYRDIVAMGMTADISLAEWMTVISGTVESVSEAKYLLNGVPVFDVDIAIDNPGNLEAGTVAHVSLGGDEKLFAAGTGTLRYSHDELITIPLIGIVDTYTLKLNTIVQEGDLLLRVREESSEQSERALQRQYTELSAQLALAMKQAERLTDFKALIYAEADGFVEGLTVETGDSPYTGSKVLTLVPDATPFIKFSLPSDTGAVFNSTARLTAEIGVSSSDDSGKATFSRLTVSGRVLSCVMKGGAYELTAAIDTFEGRAVFGQEVPIEVVQKGDTQDWVIPLECIYNTGINQQAVYVIGTRKGLFGDEDYISVMPVKVLYDNGKYASIENILFSCETVFAANPSKLMRDGDAVWVRD